tara:strand:+ start:278 stop:691 length:414 start_codon:yes stop_codon:yes gene_type:complete
MVSAKQKANASQLIFRPTNQIVTPQCAQQFVVAFAKEWIDVVPLFVTGQRPAIVFTADLPATGVATEKGHIASLGNERFEMIPHLRRPVFIVTDTEYEAIVAEYFGMKFEIRIDRVIDCEPILLGPGYKRKFPFIEL